jgi:DMSO/TMAO reductase YedYZ molybdopterin-dependent catalytic subunit|uniref:Sulfite oxidase-like oxidoreductase n=1 Tax=Anaerolinea thermolimosa TaxID=229919 RepID=A0A7C4KGJ0_9CHLR
MLDSILRRKKDEEEKRKEGRLPPGQALTNRFPVLHYGPVPAFDPKTWDFRVWGEVEQPLRLTWEEFNRLPRSRVTLDLHCVTRWSQFDMVWEGVSVRTLIELGLVKLKPTARFVMQHAENGYTANLPLEVVLQENFLLATHYDGRPLEPEHGYPLRGVVGAIPGRSDLKTPYLWKGAKWLRGLEFMAQDRLGFWEEAGYHNEADVWKEERYA